MKTMMRPAAQLMLGLIGLAATPELNFDSWTQWGLGGLSAVTLFWTITFTFPRTIARIQKSHETTMENANAAHRESMTQLCDQLGTLTSAIAGRQRPTRSQPTDAKQA